MSRINQKLMRSVQAAILMAIIVVLQLLSYFVKIGTFNLSLVLIPIVVGAVLYGPKTGALLGGVFGAVVTLCCMTGTDAGGAILWNSNPFLTALICLVKGIAAGAAAGFIVKACRNMKNPYVGVTLGAIAAPIVNTGLFLIGLSTCFHPILVEWAGGSSLMYYIVVGLVGVNFLIELALNVILAPAVVSIVKYARHSHTVGL